MKVIEGNLVVKDKKFAIVISRFNEFISSKLLSGAIDALKRHMAREEDISIIWVPGAYEIPQSTKMVIKKGGVDAVICLGAVIRGDTPHFDYVANEVSKGIAAIGLETDIPVTFGIITADTIEQAIERAGAKAGNKGADAAVSAIEMVNVFDEIKK